MTTNMNGVERIFDLFREEHNTKCEEKKNTHRQIYF